VKDNYEKLRDYSAVKRYHIMRTLRTQTVGEHSHAVAVLVMQVDPQCTATLLKAALTHDLHERATGDMPSTAKWLYPELARAMEMAEFKWNKEHEMDWYLTGHESAVLRYCDYLELLMWSTEEYRLGNRYAAEPIVNIIRVLDRLEPPTHEGKIIYEQARKAAEDIFAQSENINTEVSA